MPAVQFGIDSLQPYLKKRPKSERHAILCHPSSVDRNLRHLKDIVDESGKLVALFGPQHGIFGETQDNMIEWQDTKDERGRPVYSLYGERREPHPDSLKNVDSVIIDLFDVGARYYTFIYSMFYMLRECSKQGVRVVVLDRPNPINGSEVEGNLLDLGYKSFVGLFSIPNRHGLTIGEMAQFFNNSLSQPADLKILKLRNWQRKTNFPETNREWTLPSPNMPNYRACRLYPGICLFEGTSLSEGRGTTRPFELIGAPFMDWNQIEREYLKKCKSLDLKPVQFLRQGFIPTFHKFSGEVCRGALQIPPERGFQSLRHAVSLLWVLRKLYPDQWSWKQPPYEYEYEKLPIDILAGGPELRDCVDSQGSLKKLFNRWKDDEKSFKKLRKPFLLY